MIIDGVEYVPAIKEGGRIQIIVCHRGFVFVGRVFDEENEVVIRGAFNVRRWGTTKGLGELADRGPLTETKLDASGVVRMHPLSVVCRIDCNEEKWNASIK